MIRSSILLAILLSAVRHVYAVSIQVPITVPSSGASNVVDKHFLGLAIEGRSFPAYTGSTSQPNHFSLNMFSALTSRLGLLPIRVGGTSQDFTQWNPKQQTAVTYDVPGHTMFTDNTTLGQAWLDGLGMIPDAKWIMQLPLLRNNLTNSVAFAKATHQAMSAGSFKAFEIGNEPNFYVGVNEARPQGWDEASYVAQWIQWTNALQDNLSLPAGPNFWALSLASNADPSMWSTGGAYTSTPSLANYSDRVQAISHHYYQLYASGDLQTDLLNHTTTHNRIAGQFGPAAAGLHSMNPPIPFVLGEVGNALAANHTLQSSLGAAVWLVDVLLTSMVANIDRISLQNVVPGYFSTWWPDNFEAPGPTVWAPWYGQLLVADIINQTSGALRVAPLQIEGDNPKDVVAYATYNYGNLNKIVLLNELVWSTTSSGPRPTASVTLSGLAGVSSVRIDRMSGPSADELHNVTWAGQQWSYQSNGEPQSVKNDTSTQAVTGGAVTITLPATEAAVITVQ